MALPGTAGGLPTPLCRVGVLADAQYWASRPEDQTVQPQWSGSTRNYDGVLQHTRTALETFRGDHGTQPVDLLVQLGDLIDASNVRIGTTAVALERMLAELSAGPWGVDNVHHVVGNNDLKNFSRAELANWMPRSRPGGSPDSTSSEYHHYYDFAPCPGWRFVVLDTYVSSLFGEGSPEAKELMVRHNPNCAKLTVESPIDAFLQAAGGFNTNEHRPVFLKPDMPARRLLCWNGGLGQRQLSWLRDVLKRSKDAGELVIAFGHNPLHPSAVLTLDALALDYQEVLDVLDGAGCVVAYLAGHEHSGGYARDPRSGIHHLVMPSPLDAPVGTGSRYAVLELYDDFVRLRGEGGVCVEPGLRRHCKVCGGTGVALRSGEKCFVCDGSGVGPAGFSPRSVGRLRRHLFLGEPQGVFFRQKVDGRTEASSS